MIKDMDTAGIVFVKCKTGAIESFNSNFSNLRKELNNKKSKKIHILLTITIVGPFDFLIILKAKKARTIQKFVFEVLRKNFPDIVTDTQTFIGWEMY